jgi:hypothetical protein
MKHTLITVYNVENTALTRIRSKDSLKWEQDHEGMLQFGKHAFYVDILCDF